MENQLTTEQKARVFAQYIGHRAQAVCEKEGTPLRLHGVNAYTGYARFTYAGTHLTAPFEHVYLILRPLSAITDEDAFQLAQMLHPKANYNFIERNPRFIYVESQGGSWRICIDTENNSFAIMTGVSRNIEWNSYDIGLAYQFLTQRGYAVPLFIAPGHPLNGKTAIEMGLAIDATTL